MKFLTGFSTLEIILLLALCFSVTLLSAQADTTETIPPVEKVNYKSPKKAALFSAVIPGAGQFYVGKWHLVKIPVIYAGFVSIGIAIDFNKTNYKRFDVAYESSLAGEPHAFSHTNLTSDGLRSIRDEYRKNLELSYIGGVALYLIQVVDAFVAAHLTQFDISEDLSLELKPGFDRNNRQNTLGLVLYF